MNKAKLKKIIEKKERERKRFLSKLSLQMTCLRYVTDRVKTTQSYFDIVRELGTIELEYRLEHIKVKLYEMMLIMSETEKAKIFYDENKVSNKLFCLYQASNRYFRKSLASFRDIVEDIRKEKRQIIATNGQYDSNIRQSA